MVEYKSHRTDNISKIFIGFLVNINASGIGCGVAVGDQIHFKLTKNLDFITVEPDDV